jgi:5-(carboxyamino)imidazole ribonucleotide mutase
MWSKKIAETLSKLEIESTLRIASAHKVPLKVLEIIKGYEGEDVVFITVAGRSNALSGFVDAHTVKPVIACPPYSDKFAGADIFSSLRMPSGVCPMVVLEPEQAAIASAKILAIKNKEIEQKIREYQEKKKREIEEADKEVMQDG